MARKIVLILGLFIALLPYLGFPESLIATCSTIAGLLVAFLAWSGKRPQIASSLEEMEGELHSATTEDTSQPTSHLVPEKKNQLLPPVTPAVKTEESKQTLLETKGEAMPPLSDDKVVSVSFNKQRVRNLKKRITQEGVPPQL